MRSRRGRPRGSVVLLSGGMDSATCLAIATRDEPPVHALTVIYGQRHAREVSAARKLASHWKARRHVVLTIPVGRLLDSSLTDSRRSIPRTSRAKAGIPSTYVPARNTILLALALGYAESHGLRSIYIGVNAIDYSGYPDCRPEFLRAFGNVARLGTKIGTEDGSPVQIRAPLVRLTKADIVRLGETMRVPWKQTWSCYRGGRRPCGQCDACHLRDRGFRTAGVADPAILGGV
ncbi:MAG: 7-cyano-7-deazaguanine synthase QueC [Thermoplasmata archaeon]|jgi:7-cyano-7-deazaguanine synthase